MDLMPPTSPSLPPYVELHAHSGFSFLDGASHPEELLLRGAELGYPALALTDHDGLYGSMEFAQGARAHGIQPITGVELSLRGCSPPADPGRGEGGTSGLRPPGGGDGPAPYHVTLLAETPRGYANLSRLVTRTRMESPRDAPSLPLDALLDPAAVEGVICLTGCRRSPLLAALEGSQAEGEALAKRFRAAFGPGNLFVELQQNEARGDAARNRLLGRLADRLGLPVVATGNVHYHRRRRHRLQDVLVAIRHRLTLDGSHGVRRPNSGYHLASREEMAHRFRGREDSLAALARHPDLDAGLPLDFMQHKVPRIEADSWRPVEWPQDPSL
ncbi:MAG: PHP domain-containing protein, partial [Longimicrobiales bacterium]|nr:PHP domain-containing protein [Longimicrobiales bacterium]